MSVRKLFQKVPSMTVEEVKAFIASHKTSEYLLLDVRQPKEYEHARIPGAKLLPLPNLNDAANELAPDRAIIVYCASGGRSLVAAQLIEGKGFKKVFNMIGGIKAWDGGAATGPKEMHLGMIKGDETPSEMLKIVYGMEEGLRQFYIKASSFTGDDEAINLLSQLAKIEEKHQDQLLTLFHMLDGGDQHIEKIKSEILPERMEGGFEIDTFLTENKALLKTPTGVLETAMILEVQGMDLLLRFGDKSTHLDTRQALHEIADEEKAHIQALAQLFETKL